MLVPAQVQVLEPGLALAQVLVPAQEQALVPAQELAQALVLELGLDNR